ncbi:MAG: Hpt domain-containing protein [Gammaproteobacteria bacterium]|nr:Hpt domain-containing protein [Gammaproteobacteria bacterium]MBU1978991.1 Hpt domain-containing protein [Gammaproteobacteria bacterium]
MEKDRKPDTDMLQAMLRQLRSVFLDDLPERLDKLDNLLLAIEKRGGASVDEFNELYRILHSIKGSGGTHGLHILSAICHQFEDSLNAVSGHLAELSQAFIDSSFNYVSLLRAVVDQARRGNDTFLEIERKLLELHSKDFAVERALLLVDSSRFSANYYSQALKELPVRVVVEDNGYAALLRVLQEPFDILVTSLEVPTLNGKALIGALRLSASPNRDIKTILLTSNAELGKQKMRATDANYVVVKNPEAMANLHDAVSSILEILDNASGK